MPRFDQTPRLLQANTESFNPAYVSSAVTNVRIKISR